jgi:hypothetical protein
MAVALDAPRWRAYGRVPRLTRGGVVATDVQGPHEGWTATSLRPFDPRATAGLTLGLGNWRSPAARWWLEQAGNPVGMIERSAGGIALQTVSEKWRGAVRRRPRRLGWHLEFTRADGGGPALYYHPRTLRLGGDLVLPGGPRYTLRCPLLSSNWRLAAESGGEIGRIAFAARHDLSMRVTLGEKAADEPLLLLVILAAGEAILIQGEQPSGPMGS